MSAVYETIPLDRHGVIEAHAGTGKTFTIVQMVLRMLSEPMPYGRGGWPQLRNILLVTYTEKAAGELLGRIREGLQKKLEELQKLGAEAEPLRVHLQDNLDNLQDAWIGTIHSICLRILQQFPFESGVPFTTEMVDDRKGLQAVLRQTMRCEWAANADLDRTMRLLAELGAPFSDAEQNTLVDCGALLVDPTTRLVERSPGELENSESLRTLVRDLEELQTLQAKSREGLFAAYDALVERYDQAGDLAVSGLDSEQCGAWKSRLAAVRDARLFGTAKAALGNPKFGSKSLLKKAQLTKNPILQELESALLAIKNHEYFSHGNAIEENCAELKHRVAGLTATHIAKLWQDEKKQQGLLSFTDILRITREGVTGSVVLRKALRSQFCYALIDEFQDTSLLQWDVFRKLFVGAPEDLPSPRSSLFLVGDPKQSIYSFQGANVDTYLQAVMQIAPDCVQRLEHNYRSIPALIESCNQVVMGTQWWENKLDYPDEQKAQSPARAPLLNGGDPALEPWLRQPLRIVNLLGSASVRRRIWADFVAQSIRGLVGRCVQLPKGDRWDVERSLEYNDFAVLVETNREAQVFLDSFARAGIPAVKYKQEGVFQSEMARQVRIWFTAIDQWETRSELLSKVLVTVLGNVEPQRICAQVMDTPDPQVGQVIRWLHLWKSYADQRRWSLLVRSLEADTGVERTLLRMAEGDRLVSDLRQVLEHCHEFLATGGRNLADLVEHLKDLECERESLGKDDNLHQKQSDLKSVQVLTMHASKGLQYPVVYLATKSARVTKAPRTVRWVDPAGDSAAGLRCFPMLRGESDLPLVELQKQGAELEKSQLEQERRRLYYVAMTRAQLLLFAPIHQSEVKSKGKAGTLKIDGDKCLSAKLVELLNQAERAEHDEKSENIRDIFWQEHSRDLHLPAQGSASAWTVQDSVAQLEPISFTAEDAACQERIASVSPRDRRRRQESYTSLTPRHLALPRDVDKAQEADDSLPLVERVVEVVPRGNNTGVAWHAVLETLLSEPGLEWIDSGYAMPDGGALAWPGSLQNLVFEELKKNSVMRRVAKGSESAVIQATQSICIRALHTHYRWDEQGQERSVRLADLPVSCRLPELEFHLRASDENLLGFMDLVFRLPNPDARKHPWRYYVLDWKSNSLSEGYRSDSILSSILSSHYDEQAKLYCFAMDRWLSVLLGEAYDPSENLGGALYIYLRGLEQANDVPVWFHLADVSNDAKRVQELLVEKGRSLLAGDEI